MKKEVYDRDMKYLACDRMIELLREVSNKGFGGAYVTCNDVDNLSILTPFERKENDGWPFGGMVAYIDMDDNGSVEWTKVDENVKPGKPVSRKEAIAIATKILEDAEKERSAESEPPWRTDSPPKDGTPIIAEFDLGIVAKVHYDFEGWQMAGAPIAFKQDPIRWMKVPE